MLLLLFSRQSYPDRTMNESRFQSYPRAQNHNSQLPPKVPPRVAPKPSREKVMMARKENSVNAVRNDIRRRSNPEIPSRPPLPSQNYSGGMRDVRGPSPQTMEVELGRDNQGYGFSIRGGRELNLPIFVLRMAEGGAAQRDGRLRVREESIIGLRRQAFVLWKVIHWVVKARNGKIGWFQKFHSLCRTSSCTRNAKSSVISVTWKLYALKSLPATKCVYSRKMNCTRPVPAKKMSAYKRMKFLKSSTFKPKDKTANKKDASHMHREFNNNRPSFLSKLKLLQANSNSDFLYAAPCVTPIRDILRGRLREGRLHYLFCVCVTHSCRLETRF